MPHNLNLDALPNDAARIHAIRHHAHTLGAIAISNHFCPPNTYWADMIAPGRATLAHAATPLAAALAALNQFTEADPASCSSAPAEGPFSARTHLPARRE
jgi:hypothetical protein